MSNKAKYILAVLAVVLIILLTSFSTMVEFITDYQWFKELGYTETFLKKLVTQMKIGIPTFIIIFVAIFVYLKVIKKKYYKRSNITTLPSGEKNLNILLGLVSAAIAMFIAVTFAENLWFTILKFTNATSFNTSDPIFGNDISFYMFKIPLLSEITGLILLLAVFMVIITIGFYMIMASVRRPETTRVFDIDELAQRRNVGRVLGKKALDYAIVQIGILGFVIFVIIGLSNILKSYSLLYSTRGKVHGASYTDIHITLNMYRIMAGIAFVSAITVIVGAIKKNLKIAISAPVVLVGVSIVGSIIASGVQSFIVEPNEIAREREYLEHNIKYTQMAYNLNDVKTQDFKVEQKLTKEDIKENNETIKNIRINDYRPVKQVYYQLQGIRPYYEFKDIDIDRYYVDGEYKQMFLSARELNQSKLDSQAQTWINKHLKYTHGYGVVASPVNSVTNEGQPELVVKNIPPVTETDLKITRPEIYFGELTNDYIIVNTDEDEFDYSQGSDNVETRYEGQAGIKLSGLNKLLFSIKQKSMKMLLSGGVNSDSRIIINRNIMDRVKKIAPFISYDKDPYIVINQEDGKLYWILDGYTTSDRYPYSEPYSKSMGVNYVRNSVKVIIDAYNGDTNFYVYDETDPIVDTYRNIFPDLFKDKADIPEGLKAHIRYPQLMFNIQSEVYRLYHINNPVVFYNREDIWDVAKEKYMDSIQNTESNYVMFKLPEEENVEFLLSVPFTPASKNNMISLFVARNDGDNYGKLFTYNFPKEKTIEGPMMIEARIDQDSDISPQLTLWSQKGSEVLRGNVVVTPVKDSLLYVEPIYLKSDNEGSLPEVKRVIVAYKDNIVMEETLSEALTKVFGKVVEEKKEEFEDITEDINIEDESVKALIKQANDVFEKAKEASRNGDWKSYGEYLNQLEEILSKLSGEGAKTEASTETEVLEPETTDNTENQEE